MMMFIPVITIGINHSHDDVGKFPASQNEPHALRFAVMGSMFYTLSSFQGSLEALRSHQEITHFTHYTIGHVHLGMYGFFAPLMFAMMYYAMPRLMRQEWSSAGLIKIHFWCTLVGTIVYGLAMCIAGDQGRFHDEGRDDSSPQNRCHDPSVSLDTDDRRTDHLHRNNRLPDQFRTDALTPSRQIRRPDVVHLHAQLGPIDGTRSATGNG